MSDENAAAARCPNCDQPMHEELVRSDIWRGDTLLVIEDIPAQVCPRCAEQFYDDDTTDALRRLAMGEFTTAPIKRELIVPVYSLEGRIKRQQAEWDPDMAFRFA